MRLDLSLSVYEHAARFVGRTPWEVSRDPELLFRAHSAAYEAYRHKPVVVGIDIYNLEAEAYGAHIVEPAGNGIPAVTEHPCRSTADLARLDPFEPGTDGRIGMVLETAARLQATYPDAEVRVPVSGPFSIAASMLGLDTLLVDVALEPDCVRDALLHLVEAQVRFARAVQDRALKVAFFESAAAPPLLSPAQFRRVELPALKDAMQRVGAVAGSPVPCIIGGDTCPIIPEMVETGTTFLICPAETDRSAFVDRMAPYSGVTVRINLGADVYVNGSREDMQREVAAVRALASRRPGLLLGTGAIPFETPIENILYLRELTG